LRRVAGRQPAIRGRFFYMENKDIVNLNMSIEGISEYLVDDLYDIKYYLDKWEPNGLTAYEKLKLCAEIQRNRILHMALTAGYTEKPQPLEMIAIQLGAK
jgi:hypothetical protein